MTWINSVKPGENTVVEGNKTVQDLQMEIEAIKNRILEMEHFRIQTGTTKASFTNRIQEMEDNLRHWNCNRKNWYFKENVKSKEFLTWNIQEVWETEKTKCTSNRNRMRRIPAQRPRKYFKIRNFPNPKKKMPTKVQETYKTPNRLDKKRPYNQN